MHDIRAIRENPDAFDAGAGPPRAVAACRPRSWPRRGAAREDPAAETAQAERTRASQGGRAPPRPAATRPNSSACAPWSPTKKAEIARLEDEARAEDARLRDLLMALPNLPLDDVPDGADEDDNVEIRRWGSPRALRLRARSEHYELPAVQAGMDFETAAKLSGSRFVVLSGAVARLHRALAQFMLDTHVTENGLTETIDAGAGARGDDARHRAAAEVRRGQLSAPTRAGG